MQKTTLTHIKIFWAIALALFVTMGVLVVVLFASMNPEKLAKRANRCIHQQEKNALEVLDQLRYSTNLHLEFIHNKTNAYLVYENDSIIYWSNDSDPIPALLSDLSKADKPLVKLKNGWFLCERQKYDSHTFVALIPIYYDYNIENDYFKSRFSKELRLPDGCNICFSEKSHAVHTQSGVFLCSINFPETIFFTGWRYYVIFIVYLLCYLSVIFCLYRTYLYLNASTKNQVRLFLFFSFLMIGFSVLTLLIKKPLIIFNHPLFSPKYFAYDYLFSSLGMIFMVSIVVVLNCFFICRYLFLTRIKIAPNARSFLNILYPILSGLLYMMFYFIHKTLTMNTTVFLDLSYIFGINIYTVIMLAALCCFSIALMLLNALCSQTLVLSKKWMITLLFETFIMAYFVAILLEFHLFNMMLCALWIIVPIFFVFLKKTKLSVNLFYVSLFLFSFISVFLLDYFIEKSEENEQLLLAGEFAERGRDEEKEYFFDMLSKKIMRDSVVQHFLTHFNDDISWQEHDRVSAHIVDNYLKNNWKGYQSFVNICTASDMLYILSLEKEEPCINYFLKTIERIGEETISPNLFFISYDYASYAYLGFIQPENPNKIMPAFFLEMRPISPFKELGYPEFLVEQNILAKMDANRYSYAIYEKNDLEYSFGNTAFPLSISKPADTSSRYYFFRYEKENNLLYRISNDKLLIISKTRKGITQAIATYIYMLILYLALIYIICLFFNNRIPYITHSQLRAKLQKSISLILLLAFVLIGFTFIYFMNTLNAQKERDHLRQKTASILQAFSNHQHEIIDAICCKDHGEAEMILADLSNTFFSEINVYYPYGQLFATSNPNIFDQGFLSKLIDYQILCKIIHKQEYSVIQEEYIGNKKHLSSYTSINDYEGNTIAILNIPYFPRIGQYENDMAAFISTFLNLYSFVFLMFLLILLYMSNQITRPVHLLTENFGKMRLGKNNEHIDWSGGGEFAKLIEEYNRMVDDLEASTRKLADSERESGWREMAQQVAHEIKNPLTPMKLNVQHLQRTWKTTSGNNQEQINRFSNMLIQQIDALSDIANDFSNFAKMPDPRRRKIIVDDILSAAIAMYDNSGVKFIVDGSKNCWLFADPSMLLRVFNNLIRNAVQSFEDIRLGEIHIHLHDTKDALTIDIKDNGSGIPKDLIHRIFIPTFTTRLSGMGLGLPMVKTIIEEHDGSISVVSKENKGTCFSIVFRKNSKEQSV